jgi:hypothetical protein
MPYSRPDSCLIPGRIHALFPAGFMPYSRPDSCLIPGRITALFPADYCLIPGRIPALFPAVFQLNLCFLCHSFFIT